MSDNLPRERWITAMGAVVSAAQKASTFGFNADSRAGLRQALADERRAWGEYLGVMEPEA